MKINSSVSGLCIRGNSYQLRKMVKGFHIQSTIGKVDDLTQQQAEDIALDIINSAKRRGEYGVKLALERHKNSSAKSNVPMTIGDIAKELLLLGQDQGTRKTNKKPWRKSTLKDWQSWLNSERMKGMLSQQISSVSSQDVVDWYVMDLGKGHKAATDNAFRKLRRVFNYAIGEGIIQSDATSQMAKSERKYVVPTRTNRLANDTNEVGRFALALFEYAPRQKKETHNTVVHICLLSLLTGRRISELQFMKWDWVDWNNNLILLPGEVSRPLDKFEGVKNRQDYRIPMSRIVLTMLRTRQRKAQSSPSDSASRIYVFCGRGNKGPITNFRKTLSSIVSFAEIKAQNLIHHDLRRTYSDLAYKVRPDFFATKQMMGHSAQGNKDVTERYLSELPLTSRREIAQAVADLVSRSMPVINFQLGDKVFNYSGLEDYDSENENIIDGRIFTKHSLELMLFNPIWRDKEWLEHNGIDDWMPFEALEKKRALVTKKISRNDTMGARLNDDAS
jgi:integrase